MDIVTLQEAWEAEAVSTLIEEASDELPYFVIEQPAKQAETGTYSRLAVLLRGPIEEARTLIYGDCTASRRAVHFVVVYPRIQP